MEKEHKIINISIDDEGNILFDIRVKILKKESTFEFREDCLNRTMISDKNLLYNYTLSIKDDAIAVHKRLKHDDLEQYALSQLKIS